MIQKNEYRMVDLFGIQPGQEKQSQALKPHYF